MDHSSTNVAGITGAADNKDNGIVNEIGLKGEELEAETLSSKTNRRLRLRVDFIVLPLMTMASVIALLDKASQAPDTMRA